MDDPLGLAVGVRGLVRRVEPRRSVSAEATRHGHWQEHFLVAKLANDVAEVLTRQVLHCDEEAALIAVDIKDLNDVWVAQGSCKPRLVEEHLDELTVLTQVRQNTLDDDKFFETSKTLLNREEDLRHSSSRDPPGEFVL